MVKIFAPEQSHRWSIHGPYRLASPAALAQRDFVVDEGSPSSWRTTGGSRRRHGTPCCQMRPRRLVTSTGTSSSQRWPSTSRPATGTRPRPGPRTESCGNSGSRSTPAPPGPTPSCTPPRRSSAASTSPPRSWRSRERGRPASRPCHHPGRHPRHRCHPPAPCAVLEKAWAVADDITYLVKHLGLTSTADVLAVCTTVFPDEPVPDRSRLILDDLFDEASHARTSLRGTRFAPRFQ
jgi:hypothetical protein